VHVAEGILTPGVAAGGWVLAAAGIGAGLRRLDPDAIPKVGVLSSTFFVASLIQVPLGPASAHLVLNGLMGVLLGWQVFPALAVALILQAVFFGFGGLTSLGANVLIMGVPALLARLVFAAGRPPVEARSATLVRGGLAGATGIVGGAALLSLFLAASGREFAAAVAVIAAAHLPVAGVEALVAGAVLSFLARVRPELLPPANLGDRSSQG